MRNKYYNDAIIGNGKILASFSKTGELLRLYYPNIDNKQFIDEFVTGFKINDSCFVNLADDVNNKYNQYFTANTNILNTEILNNYFNIKITGTDFIDIKENLLIKKYRFSNYSNEVLDVDFIIKSMVLSDYNNYASGYFKEDALIQYTHDNAMYIFSNQKSINCQINNAGNDYIGMSKDSSISYNIKLNPKEEKELDIFIKISDNINEDINKIKKINTKNAYQNTKKYWENFLANHNSIEIKNKTHIEKIYKRSILLFALLQNNETGGISAGVEVDENMTKCGRYSYCWPRDAIFITKALDILNMHKETEKFYKTFCKNTQSANGMWEQRFYTDEKLAPCWGYQIDETASVIHGIYEHYKINQDIKFLKENLKMCEKATIFLKTYVENILSKKEVENSYDLWEENKGIHTYSLSAIFSAFECMTQIYIKLEQTFEKNRVKFEKIHKEIAILETLCLEIKGYVLKNLYSNKQKSFLRNNNDIKTDISLLGLVTPFNMFLPNEKKILNTIDRINLTIKTYTGGYKRYECDTYINGNPWPIANLWMALYYIELGDFTKAKECFDFVVLSYDKLHGYLGEQVSNETLQPNWVIGLGWSHAMFIIVLDKLVENGVI